MPPEDIDVPTILPESPASELYESGIQAVQELLSGLL